MRLTAVPSSVAAPHLSPESARNVCAWPSSGGHTRCPRPCRVRLAPQAECSGQGRPTRRPDARADGFRSRRGPERRAVPTGVDAQACPKPASLSRQPGARPCPRRRPGLTASAAPQTPPKNAHGSSPGNRTDNPADIKAGSHPEQSDFHAGMPHFPWQARPPSALAAGEAHPRRRQS